ncbi:hypothetical protein ABVV53_11550 [Novosphingobium sp. RD2P27]|uniref:Uncharacterized protein n=1 Tax=Novosphingobium kalidii TaxID=3230299 RepID=A0ABV2D2J7_9SPHN
MTALLRAVSGLIVWAVAFSALYGLQGLGCALGWDAMMVGPIQLGRAALIALWLAFVAVQAWMIWHFSHHTHGSMFLNRLAVAIAVIGWVATIYTGVPVVTTSMCF